MYGFPFVRTLIIMNISNTLAWDSAFVREQHMCTNIRVHKRLLEKPSGKIDVCLVICWFQALNSLRMVRMHSVVSQNLPHLIAGNAHCLGEFPQARFRNLVHTIQNVTRNGWRSYTPKTPGILHSTGKGNPFVQFFVQPLKCPHIRDVSGWKMLSILSLSLFCSAVGSSLHVMHLGLLLIRVRVYLDGYPQSK